MQELRIVIDECTDDHIILTTVAPEGSLAEHTDSDGAVESAAEGAVEPGPEGAVQSASDDAARAGVGDANAHAPSEPSQASQPKSTTSDSSSTSEDASAPRFRLPITEDLLLLTSMMAQAHGLTTEPHGNVPAASEDAPVDAPVDASVDATEQGNAAADAQAGDTAAGDSAAPSATVSSATADSGTTSSATKDSDATGTTTAEPTAAGTDTASAPTPDSAAASTDTAGGGSTNSPTDGADATAQLTNTPASSPLTLSPRDIQTRIRGGASIEELAAQAGVPASRIEPFAHPILVERERIAEVARRAYPVRGDGPATLTLWEVLATSFAARGMNLADTTWDSFRDEHRVWHVTVSWRMPNGTGANAPIKTYTAVWSYHPDPKTPRAVAVNSLATELIDPDFGRRPSVAGSTDGTSGRDSRRGSGRRGSVADIPLPGSGASAAAAGEDTAEADLEFEDPAFATSRFAHGPAALAAARAARGTGDVVSLADRTRGAVSDGDTSGDGNSAGQGTAGNTADAAEATDTADTASAGRGEAEDSTGFLEFPAAERGTQGPKHRRRKAVTPHWEDVLLGVRPRKNEEK